MPFFCTIQRFCNGLWRVFQRKRLKRLGGYSSRRKISIPKAPEKNESTRDNCYSFSALNSLELFGAMGSHQWTYICPFQITLEYALSTRLYHLTSIFNTHTQHMELWFTMLVSEAHSQCTSWPKYPLQDEYHSGDDPRFISGFRCHISVKFPEYSRFASELEFRGDSSSFDRALNIRSIGPEEFLGHFSSYSHFDFHWYSVIVCASTLGKLFGELFLGCSCLFVGF